MRAHRDSELLAVAREDFDDLLRKDEEFALALMRAIGEKLRVSAARVDPSASPTA